MPASFAGVTLNLADPGGAVQAWCDRYRPFDDLVPVCTPAAYCDGRDRPQRHDGHPVGFPTFNWIKRPPRWRINSLWWPTGASRFSIGLFLTTLSGANAIKAAVDPSGGALLTLNDGTRSISTTMYMLPPRPIGAVGTDNPVVLLPLVDLRYFWQWAHVGQLTVTPATTWFDLRFAIAAGLGVSVSTSAEPTDYPAPDWSEWQRYYENAALAMDAYAATVGQRFIAGLLSTYQLQTSSAVLGTCQSNLTNLSTMAGGECLSSPAIVPANVAVAFPRRQGGIPHQSGACDLITKPASAYGFSTSGPGTAVIHTTFQADYSDRSQAANLTDMGALANAIARDWYGWKQKQYSATSTGVNNTWTLTGFDDYLWFMFGTQVGQIDPCDCDEAGEAESFRADEFEKPSPYLAQTLIESLPPNFGVEENLTQTPGGNYPTTFRPVPLFRAELTTDFGTGGTTPAALGRLLAGNTAGALVKDGFDVKIFDTMGLRGQSRASSRCWVAALPSDTDMFELVSCTGLGSNQVLFQLTADLPLGGTAAAIDVSNSSPIIVVDPFSNPGCWRGLSGYRGIGVLRVDGAYNILFMERPALLIEYQLYADFDQQAGFAQANVLAYYQQGNKRISAANPYQVNIYDPLDLNFAAINGEKGLAVWNDQRGRYEFLGGSSLYEFVTVNQSQASEGQLVTADFTIGGGSRVFSGQVVRPTSLGVLTMRNVRPCWIAFCDYGFNVPLTIDIVAEQEKVYGPAKLLGNVTTAGGTRPLYMASVGEQEWEATCPDDHVKGDIVEFALLDRAGNKGPSLDALLKWGDYEKNKKAVVKLMNGLLVGKQAEC